MKIHILDIQRKIKFLNIKLRESLKFPRSKETQVQVAGTQGVCLPHLSSDG